MAGRFVEITVEIPPDSQARIKKLSALPDDIMPAIKRGMDRSVALVRGSIQKDRLSGKGPYPPEEHRLGERSGKMREALVNEPAVIQGKDTVVASILWQHKYGHVHEFGMTILGKPVMRFQIAGQWIMARKVVIPERAPVRFGVTEKVDLIASEIGIEIDKSLKDASA
jgi:hypothetical protein